MKTVKLMIQTNRLKGQRMLYRQFADVIWAQDNLETVAHYYEGCVLEIEVKLLKSLQRQYIRNYSDAARYKNGYTWGTAEMRCPAGANWYSFSKNYILNNLISIKEIHPDLQKYQDYD